MRSALPAAANYGRCASGVVMRIQCVRQKTGKRHSSSIISFLCLLFLALAFSAVALPNDSQAAGSRKSVARDTVTRECSIRGFKSAKEYNSSTFP
jgi:hypothetical protein